MFIHKVRKLPLYYILKKQLIFAFYINLKQISENLVNVAVLSRFFGHHAYERYVSSIKLAVIMKQSIIIKDLSHLQKNAKHGSIISIAEE